MKSIGALFLLLLLVSCKFEAKVAANDFIGELEILNAKAFNGERKYNQSFFAKYPGITATWDGRILFRPEHIGNQNYRWDVYALRADHIKTTDGKPDFMHSDNYSNHMTLDSDGDFNSPNNIAKIKGRLHLAVSPDMDYAENPYPSDVNGNPVLNESSRYRTYKIVIVGKGREAASYQLPEGIPGFFFLSTGTIVVRDLDESDSRIVKAELDQEGGIIRRSSNSEPFFGFEPSLSLDGRLLTWNGHPDNGRINYIMYSYNPNPKQANGWSQPRSISDMYWYHGPGASSETIVDGIAFSDRYPIAKQALRDAYGNIMTRGMAYPGAYPWLSYDASELFASVLPTFHGPRRAAFSVVGRMTNWTIRHVDGDVNKVRGNVTDSITNWLHEPTGAELKEKYDNLIDQYGNPIGRDTFQRILVTPLGLFPSMWQPFLHSHNNKKSYFTEQPYTYAFFLSHSKRFVEVDLHHNPDGNYLLYWPLNEAVTYNHDLIREDIADERSDWERKNRIAYYEPTRSPDLSGNFQTAELRNGAQFSFEYFEAKKAWRENRVVYDGNMGLSGNSIFFPPGSYVETNLNEVLTSDAWTFSFFIQPYQEIQDTLVFNWQDQIHLKYNDMGNWTFSYLYRGRWIEFSKVPFKTSINRWSHIAVVVTKSGIQFVQDGSPIARVRHNFSLMPKVKNIKVGAMQSNVNSSSALYLIDEFQISKVARNLEELSRMALVPEVEKQTDVPGLLVPGHLSGMELNVPKEYTHTLTKQELGERLFNDTILSLDRSVSCASCHIATKAFTDGLPLAVGIGGRLASRNTPSILDSVSRSHLMWDGRSLNLKEQAFLPIENPNEMGLKKEVAISRLRSNATYQVLFRQVFGSEVNLDNLAEALMAFQISQFSPENRDDLDRLDAIERNGKGLFYGKARCASCHMGPTLDSAGFHNIGLAPNSDIGRETVTGRESDRHHFKVPSLRNVASTEPYFHNGEKASLDEVIDFYDRGGDSATRRSLEIHPLGLTNEEKQALKAYLLAL